MNCQICREPIGVEWHFCRWCGAALAACASGPAMAKTRALDSVLNSLFSSAQSAQSQPVNPQKSMSDEEYLGYLQAGIVPSRY